MVDVRRFFENTDAALNQLCVLGMQIDHQVAIHVAETSHCSRGQHVENHLLRRAGLHASRASNYFRPDFSNDVDVGGFSEWRFLVARDGNGSRPASPRILDSGYRKRGASAGGDADDNIFLGRLLRCNCIAPHFLGIFVGFNGRGQRLGAPCDDELHHARRNVKGRWTFCRVKRSDASTAAGAHIDHPPAARECRGDKVDRLCNPRKRLSHCVSDLGVLLVDNPRNFKRRHLIEISGCGIRCLGHKAANLFADLSISCLSILAFYRVSCCFTCQEFIPKASLTAS